MNPELILTKLESLSRCLERIRTTVPESKELFLDSWDAQDIVLKNLERAVQISVDVANHIVADSGNPPPGSMSMAFFFLGRQEILESDLVKRMQATVGLRNLAVHEYESLDYGRIYDTVAGGLGIFEDYARSILKFLKSKP